MKGKKLYLVVWRDSYTTGEHWQKTGKKKLGLTCTSVGWITRKTKHYIQVTPHKTNIKNGTVCGSMNIPKSAIIKKKLL